MNRLCLAAWLLTALLLSIPARADEPVPVPTVIESSGPNEMISSDTESTFTFRNDVIVTGTNLRLACDLLVVVATRKSDPGATLAKQENFKSLVATGHVRIVQGDREATCGIAEVYPGDNKIILSDAPVVIDRSNNSSVAGKRILLFRGERRAVVEGGEQTPTRLTLPAIKDLGFDPNKPAPEPARPAESK